jgi:hypothetical protein
MGQIYDRGGPPLMNRVLTLYDKQLCTPQKYCMGDSESLTLQDITDSEWLHVQLRNSLDGPPSMRALDRING